MPDAPPLKDRHSLIRARDEVERARLAMKHARDAGRAAPIPPHLQKWIEQVYTQAYLIYGQLEQIREATKPERHERTRSNHDNQKSEPGGS
jgi:hypothetical protein